MQEDSVSTPDNRQPFHMVNGETIDQREWRKKLRTCTELLEEFKRQAYKDGSLK